MTDATGTLNLFDNGLVYHSAPFDNPTEITDTLKLTAWIVMEVPDTDFSVSVDEVLPSGPTVHLTQDAMRARYRE